MAGFNVPDERDGAGGVEKVKELFFIIDVSGGLIPGDESSFDCSECFLDGDLEVIAKEFDQQDFAFLCGVEDLFTGAGIEKSGGGHGVPWGEGEFRGFSLNC